MTAVEFLKQNLPSLFIEDSGHYETLFEQAKEMEKQQIEISDEEIEKGAEENTCYMNDFILGAKWYREQLKAKPWTPKEGKPYDWFNEEYAMEKFKEQLKSRQ